MKRLSTPRKSKPKTPHNGKNTTAGNVRIIGGQFKRRNVTFIDADGLRPTPDRLRETLFNWLLTDINSARVLDSCAGSGVLGFEALSRGAAHCTFIETNRTQSQLLLQNAQQLRIDVDHYRIIHGAAEQVLSQNNNLNQPSNQDFNVSFNAVFDVVFIDPPYADDLWQPILTALIAKELITVKTLIYLEADKDLNPQLDELTISLQETLSSQGLVGFNCLKQTKAGQVVAGLYQLVSS
ncbi:16S rRNA (guanine(966)-N(2))-methyltransferase RsmD [Psychrobacter urativorans]|uniref:16S rRNA (guanine(966)-N(2))-methyltransferase RsmD n=1 Tax=Psychrobacter urativorans TaxID=45610 RepID=UPI00191AF6D9|nr:16S rRNA (guanine(966)-N(2))-methyltransferase RsmD [Psychrobacter urativorans]